MTKKQDFLQALQELKILEARIRNRDPGPEERLFQENSSLMLKISEMEKRVFEGLSKEGTYLPDDQERARLETIRSRTLDFLKTLKVDPKLWQDLASL